MMYLSRLRINTSRLAALWTANPYRVHQRLMMACDGDPRLLFRIEDTFEKTQILVQSHVEPNWPFAFADLDVLRCTPEHKMFDLFLQPGRIYRFRLLANPAIVKTIQRGDGSKEKNRLGLFKEEDQRTWLMRKFEGGGAKLVSAVIAPRGLQRCTKNPAKNGGVATHYAVLFEGVLKVQNSELLTAAVESGVGPAKGFGFGLLSLAPA